MSWLTGALEGAKGALKDVGVGAMFKDFMGTKGGRATVGGALLGGGLGMINGNGLIGGAIQGAMAGGLLGTSRGAGMAMAQLGGMGYAAYNNESIAKGALMGRMGYHAYGAGRRTLGAFRKGYTAGGKSLEGGFWSAMGNLNKEGRRAYNSAMNTYSRGIGLWNRYVGAGREAAASAARQGAISKLTIGTTTGPNSFSAIPSKIKTFGNRRRMRSIGMRPNFNRFRVRSR